MADALKPMKQLQELLQDADLRREIEGAQDEQTVIRLVMEAGEPRGYTFGENWLRSAFDDVKLARAPVAPTEEELLQLASTYMRPADTAPKLCHTESCGGHPGSCC